MDKEQALAVFENYRIRRVYGQEAEKWCFSVVDVLAALIQQPDYQAARNYWKVLKNRLKKEGSESVTNCNRLKLAAAEKRNRKGGIERMNNGLGTCFRKQTRKHGIPNSAPNFWGGVLRIIQSVPSPKAEPIKLWLAKVGYERMEDMSDPARSLDRAREYWKKHGRSEKWIQRRMMGQAGGHRRELLAAGCRGQEPVKGGRTDPCGCGADGWVCAAV